MKANKLKEFFEQLPPLGAKDIKSFKKIIAAMRKLKPRHSLLKFSGTSSKKTADSMLKTIKSSKRNNDWE